MPTVWAMPDSYSVVHDHVLNAASVLANDFNDNTDPLTAVLTSGPSHGSITFNSNGTFQLTPNAGYVGSDYLGYQAWCNDQWSTTSVEIMVTNTAPTAVGQSLSIGHDQILTNINLLANSYDADGDTLTASIASGPSHGQITQNGSGLWDYTPNASWTGTDSATVTTSDGIATSWPAPFTFNVTNMVTNTAPTAVGQSLSIGHDQVLTDIDLLANAYDADGDALTATIASGPSHGQLTQNARGLWDYTPDPLWTGSDSFSASVSDGIATSWPATFTLNTTNTAPIAIGDEYFVRHDQVLELDAAGGVLANDRDEEFDSLSATLVQVPAHGSLSLDSEGAFTYSPNAYYAGDDSFSYFASDGIAQSSTTFVTIHVLNTVPTALEDRYHFEPGIALEVATGMGVLTNDTDPDDVLTVALVLGPQSGTLILNQDGSFNYTPNENFSGDDSFTYKAMDALGAYSQATVELSAGAIVRNNSYTVDHNQVLDVPVDLGVLSNAEGIDAYATVSLMTGPANGNLVLNLDGSFTYQANSGFTGNDQFTYGLYYGSTSPLTRATVTISVTSAVPIGIPDFYAVDTGQQSLTVSAAEGVLANDYAGDSLTAALVQPPTKGSVSFNGDGSFVYTPNPGATGRDVFTYKPLSGAAQGEVIPVNLVLALNPRPYTVSGTWFYNQTGGAEATRRPVRRATVQILAGDNTVLGTGGTDELGNFSIPLPRNPGRFRVQVATASRGMGTKEVFYMDLRVVRSSFERTFKIRMRDLFGTSPNTDGRDLNAIAPGPLPIGDNTDTQKAFWTFDALVTASKLHNTIPGIRAGTVLAQRELLQFPTSFTILEIIC